MPSRTTCSCGSGVLFQHPAKGFVKDGNKNRLRDRDIKKIVDVFTEQLELPKYSRFVPNEEIQQTNEYNLNIPRYIDAQEPEDAQDIDAHLKGGIPNADIDGLADYWQVCPTLKDAIFKPSARKGYSDLSIPADAIKQTILSHREFETFRSHVLEVFASWQDKTTGFLKDISTKDHPKAIIQAIADDLLTTCADLLLIDKYAVYQHLMTYWTEMMQDDAYIVTVDGWLTGTQVVRLQKETKGKKKDMEGLSGLEGRLIPISLLISTYFPAKQTRLDELNAKLEQIGAQMDEFKDEHSGDEGLLAGVIDDKDKVSKGAVQTRMKEIKSDDDFADELVVLQKYATLFDEEVDTKKATKEAEKDLEQQVLTKYPALSLKEIKTLVVERKWMDALRAAVQGEVDRISHQLAGRMQELAARYESTLPEIVDNVEELSAKVDAHLKNMGFVWE